jgi:YfiH family protein
MMNDAARSRLARLPGITPDWSVSDRVQTLITLRTGGVSAGDFGAADGAAVGLNLGEHVGDDPAAVRENRARLQAGLPGPICWLQQVHGVNVHQADSAAAAQAQVPPIADAAITMRAGQVLAIMTADCLPLLLADQHGRIVGAVHAGWRGLAAGVIEATVDAMRARLGEDAELAAWLGPAIGPASFEVGREVMEAFCEQDGEASSAFMPGPAAGKYWADLYALARRRLAARDVTRVSGGELCTVRDPARFYSHRRDRRTGRMASLIWLIA